MTTNQRSSWWWRFVGVAAISLLIGSCGGGDGAGSDSSQPPAGDPTVGNDPQENPNAMPAVLKRACSEPAGNPQLFCGS